MGILNKIFGLKKAPIKSTDLARKYIDEIFSDDYENLYGKLFDELKSADSALESVNREAFVNELAAVYLAILSFAWSRACFDLKIWPQKFVADFSVVILKDGRCQKIRNEYKVYNEAIGRSGKSGLSAFKEITDAFLQKTLTKPTNIKKDSADRIELEFETLWHSMTNGFKLFEVG